MPSSPAIPNRNTLLATRYLRNRPSVERIRRQIEHGAGLGPVWREHAGRKHRRWRARAEALSVMKYDAARGHAMMRSKLFVPGSRPELFDKAYRSAADAISFDLEDAVAPDRKVEARACVADALSRPFAGSRKTTIIRVNGFESGHFEADIEAVACEGLDVVNLPKIESADDIRRASECLARLEASRAISRPIGILANIETPRGVRLAAEIALADRRVIGLQIGFGDLFEPYGSRVTTGRRSTSSVYPCASRRPRPVSRPTTARLSGSMTTRLSAPSATGARPWIGGQELRRSATGASG